MLDERSPNFNPAIHEPVPKSKKIQDLMLNALEVLERKQFNPLEEFVDIFKELKGLEDGAKEESISSLLSVKRLQVDILKEVTGYAFPKLKSVEHTGQIDTGITVIVGVPPRPEPIDITPKKEMLDRHEDIDGKMKED
jgi:hypothetical protein